ncbi:MAG: hypothetical protein H0X01_06720, partial [Nitrospira sp.]|nr:hypothetical protein [Nitrospira sp.]
LPAGNYDLIPGHSNSMGDVPGITDKGSDVPGSITTPKGTKRTVLWIHPQANLSQGCITVKDNKAFIERIQAAIKEDGGRIGLVIVDVGECKPCEECKK